MDEVVEEHEDREGVLIAMRDMFSEVADDAPLKIGNLTISVENQVCVRSQRPGEELVRSFSAPLNVVISLLSLLLPYENLSITTLSLILPPFSTNVPGFAEAIVTILGDRMKLEVANLSILSNGHYNNVFVHVMKAAKLRTIWLTHLVEYLDEELVLEEVGGMDAWQAAYLLEIDGFKVEPEYLEYVLHFNNLELTVRWLGSSEIWNLIENYSAKEERVDIKIHSEEPLDPRWMIECLNVLPEEERQIGDLVWFKYDESTVYFFCVNDAELTR